MTPSSLLSSAAKDEQRPGWFLTAALFAVLTTVLRLADVWSWWIILWAPLFVLAVGSAAHEWQLTVRNRWHLGPMEWVLLVVAHLALAASLALVLGLLPR